MTCPMGLARRPARIRSRYADSVATIPPPVPPRVNAGRMMAGSPMTSRAPFAEASRAASVAPSTITLGAYGWPDPVEQVAERLAVLGHPDRLERRAEQADVVALEDARLGERHRQVERRLAAEARQESLGLLAGDDRLDRLDRQRLEVDDVRHRRVGHDRRRVAVDEDRPDALGAEGTAGLRPGVVELGGLADDHRARPQDQDRRGLGPGGVIADDPARVAAAATNRSNTASASSGPGAPSGWYWTVSIGSSRWRRPSTEPSLRLTWLTRNPLRSGTRVADDLHLVVLRRDLDQAHLEVLDRVVRPVVAEAQASRVGTRRAPDDLVAEADPQQGPAVVDDGARQRDLCLQARRIAWSGRQDHPIDVAREDLGRRRRVREDPDPGAAVPHRPNDVRLEAEVHDADARAGVNSIPVLARPPAGRRGSRSPGPPSAPRRGPPRSPGPGPRGRAP